MDTPPSLWIVLDPKDGPEFAAAWREGAHDHIKDCLDVGIHEAARWVVREYVPADENTRLRAEVEALKLERTAAELVHRETATTVLMQMAEVQRLRDALKPFAAIDLTTNQAVDPMDVLRARRALRRE